MKYVMMTMKEAQKVLRKDAKVLVSVQDLTQEDCNIGFEKKNFCDCSEMLKEAETIAKVYGDFANQLRCFSEEQVDPINYKPKGTLNIILLRD